MRVGNLGLLILVMVLAACGGRGGDARTACEAAIADRMSGKTYRLDGAALQASAKEEGADVLVLTGEVVIDPGMTGEQRQTVECKARFDAGQDRPDVISLNFLW